VDTEGNQASWGVSGEGEARGDEHDGVFAQGIGKPRALRHADRAPSTFGADAPEACQATQEVMCIGSKRLYSGPKRRDANQRKIVQVLRKLGASVVITADVGRGFPDLVVGYGGVTYLVEVKNRSTLRRSQRAFREQWRGGEIVLLRSPEEAVQWLARLRDAQQASEAPDSGTSGA